MAKNFELTLITVDFSAIGTVEVRQNKAIVIALDLKMAAADSLIIELNRVPFFAANGHRRGQVVINSPAVGPVENSQRDVGHVELSDRRTARRSPRG